MPLKEMPGAVKPEAVPAPALAAPGDRRRPGRAEQISPHLIPLLRTSELDAPAIPDLWEDRPFDDTMAPARGLAMGLLLSVPVWAVIGGIVWVVL